MLISILFVLLFVVCLAGIVLLPKLNGRINLVKALIMGTMALFCYLAMFAFVYEKVGIAVSIHSTCVSMVLAAAGLWGTIYKKKTVQKIFIRWWDVAVVAVLVVFVGWISIHMFTPTLKLSYINSDPANHFNNAMHIVKYGKFKSNMYFSAFIDAMFIQLLAPVLSFAQYYKAFIAADIFKHMLEICMFYVLILTVSRKKPVRYMAPLFCLGYFFGYPAYSYTVGGFVYWSTGVMILMLMIYAMLLLERYPQNRKQNVILLLLAAYANSCCNLLFVPVNYLALIAALAVWMVRKKKGKINKRIVLCIAGMIAAAAVVVLYLFLYKWDGSFENVIEYVSVPGAMYHSMYADFVFFIPAMVLVFYYVFRNPRYSKTICVMSVCMIACTVAMYWFLYNEMMSLYYYYKIYYNLWLFAWLLVVMAFHIMIHKNQLPSFFSYMSMIAMIAVLTFTNYDVKMWERMENYNDYQVPKHFFPLYWTNMETLQAGYEEYIMPEEILDVFSYTAEQMGDEKIPALVANEDYFYWHDGMRAQNTRSYRAFRNELMDILRKMDKNGIKHIVIDKEDEVYQNYQNYFKLCKVVYENPRAAVLTYAGESWCDILSVLPEYSEGKLELYSYIKKNLKEERVPLMAEKASCVDYVIYREKTKKKCNDCYPWNYSPKENLDNLNELGIKYVLLLHEDAFYQQNQAYFDAQEIVFENEAGKIVRCIGNSWMTEYEAAVETEEASAP